MTSISANQLRILILKASKRANIGHIGSALSVADIIAVLVGNILNGLGTDSQERDRFVMSKGHAALAFYAALHLKGILTASQFETYCQDGTLLGTHPEHRLTGVDFSTGSLGQGLSMGAGAALAARISASKRRVFVLVSDAECNEGSLWEGVMFAGHHKLSALTVIVDNNGQQATGYTRDVINQDKAADRWRAFGWQVADVDGHNTDELTQAMQEISGSEPRVIIANTHAGQGVSFMKSEIRWHYLPMSDAEFEEAIAEVSKSL